MKYLQHSFASLSVCSALATMVGASCCVLPLLVFQAGISSALIAQLGIFTAYKTGFMLLALGALLAGLTAAKRGALRLNTGFLTLYSVAVFLVMGALVMPYFELDLLIFFGFRGG